MILVVNIESKTLTEQCLIEFFEKNRINLECSLKAKNRSGCYFHKYKTHFYISSRFYERITRLSKLVDFFSIGVARFQYDPAVKSIRKMSYEERKNQKWRKSKK